MAFAISANQKEIACVRNQHQSVTLPVTAYLAAVRRQPNVVARRLDLNDSALGYLTFSDPAPLHLRRRVEAKIGQPCSLISNLTNAEDPWPEQATDGVQQVGKRNVTRLLRSRATRRVHMSQVGKVLLDCLGEFLTNVRHNAAIHFRGRTPVSLP